MSQRVLSTSLIVGAVIMGLGGMFFFPFVLAFAALIVFPAIVAYIALMVVRTFNRYLLKEDFQEQAVHTVNWEQEEPWEWVNPFVTASEKPVMVAQSAEDEIVSIRQKEIAALEALLPSDSMFQENFSEHNGIWHFRFRARSSQCDFLAEGNGATPGAAFREAEQILLRDLKQWHEMREGGDRYVSPAAAAFLGTDKNQPIALIVDDDMELARATAKLFERTGCKALVATQIDEAKKLIIQEDVDIIVLDWLLGETERGDQLVQEVTHFIEHYNDLRSKFAKKQPRIVTYSVLDRSQVHVPESRYFTYYDHWTKSTKIKDLVNRTHDLVSEAS